MLVIDEADKAPTSVTSILKYLLSDREMLLSDGRVLTKGEVRRKNEIKIHKDFRCIVLANRPG